MNFTSLEPPAYAVMFVDKERTIVHFHDFLDDRRKFIYDPAAPVEAQIVLLEPRKSALRT